VRPVTLARGYFGLQALAGVAWWVGVFASDGVRTWTLGQWDPTILVGPDLLLFVGASAWAAVLGSRIAALVVALWASGVAIVLTAYGLLEQTAGWGVLLMSAATLGSLVATALLWFGRVPTGWFFVGPFSFRVATEGSGGRHLRRSLVQLAVFWTTFFVLVPLVLAAVERRLQLELPALDRPGPRVVGGVVFLVASALGLWSCVTMALRGRGTPLPAQTARDLVVVGPYRWVRNPMAVAGAFQTAAVGLWVGSWLVIVVAVAGAVSWNELIRPGEEADLATRFGPSYQQYSEQVRCWIPSRPARLTGEESPQAST
jgi:protein-S-isoprenylcysteine O-methyltransferase Ste14